MQTKTTTVRQPKSAQLQAASELRNLGHRWNRFQMVGWDMVLVLDTSLRSKPEITVARINSYGNVVEMPWEEEIMGKDVRFGKIAPERMAEVLIEGEREADAEHVLN